MPHDAILPLSHAAYSPDAEERWSGLGHRGFARHEDQDWERRNGHAIPGKGEKNNKMKNKNTGREQRDTQHARLDATMTSSSGALDWLRL